MAYGVSNGHVTTDDITWPQRCCVAVQSAILATAWLLVIFVIYLHGGPKKTKPHTVVHILAKY